MVYFFISLGVVVVAVFLCSFDDRPIQLGPIQKSAAHNAIFFIAFAIFLFHFCGAHETLLISTAHRREERRRSRKRLFFSSIVRLCCRIFSHSTFCRRMSGRVLLNFIVVCWTEWYDEKKLCFLHFFLSFVFFVCALLCAVFTDYGFTSVLCCECDDGVACAFTYCCQRWDQSSESFSLPFRKYTITMRVLRRSMFAWCSRDNVFNVWRRTYTKHKKIICMFRALRNN